MHALPPRSPHRTPPATPPPLPNSTGFSLETAPAGRALNEVKKPVVASFNALSSSTSSSSSSRRRRSRTSSSSSSSGRSRHHSSPPPAQVSKSSDLNITTNTTTVSATAATLAASWEEPHQNQGHHHTSAQLGPGQSVPPRMPTNQESNHPSTITMCSRSHHPTHSSSSAAKDENENPGRDRNVSTREEAPRPCFTAVNAPTAASPWTNPANTMVRTPIPAQNSTTGGTSSLHQHEHQQSPPPPTPLLASTNASPAALSSSPLLSALLCLHAFEFSLSGVDPIQYPPPYFVQGRLWEERFSTVWDPLGDEKVERYPDHRQHQQQEQQPDHTNPHHHHHRHDSNHNQKKEDSEEESGDGGTKEKAKAKKRGAGGRARQSSTSAQWSGPQHTVSAMIPIRCPRACLMEHHHHHHHQDGGQAVTTCETSPTSSSASCSPSGLRAVLDWWRSQRQNHRNDKNIVDLDTIAAIMASNASTHPPNGSPAGHAKKDVNGHNNNAEKNANPLDEEVGFAVEVYCYGAPHSPRSELVGAARVRLDTLLCDATTAAAAAGEEALPSAHHDGRRDGPVKIRLSLRQKPVPMPTWSDNDDDDDNNNSSSNHPNSNNDNTSGGGVIGEFFCSFDAALTLPMGFSVQHVHMGPNPLHLLAPTAAPRMESSHSSSSPPGAVAPASFPPSTIAMDWLPPEGGAAHPHPDSQAGADGRRRAHTRTREDNGNGTAGPPLHPPLLPRWYPHINTDQRVVWSRAKAHPQRQHQDEAGSCWLWRQREHEHIVPLLLQPHEQSKRRDLPHPGQQDDHHPDERGGGAVMEEDLTHIPRRMAVSRHSISGGAVGGGGGGGDIHDHDHQVEAPLVVYVDPSDYPDVAAASVLRQPQEHLPPPASSPFSVVSSSTAALRLLERGQAVSGAMDAAGLGLPYGLALGTGQLYQQAVVVDPVPATSSSFSSSYSGSPMPHTTTTTTTTAALRPLGHFTVTWPPIQYKLLDKTSLSGAPRGSPPPPSAEEDWDEHEDDDVEVDAIFVARMIPSPSYVCCRQAFTATSTTAKKKATTMMAAHDDTDNNTHHSSAEEEEEVIQVTLLAHLRFPAARRWRMPWRRGPTPSEKGSSATLSVGVDGCIVPMLDRACEAGKLSQRQKAPKIRHNRPLPSRSRGKDASMRLPTPSSFNGLLEEPPASRAAAAAAAVATPSSASSTTISNSRLRASSRPGRPPRVTEESSRRERELSSLMAGLTREAEEREQVKVMRRKRAGSEEGAGAVVDGFTPYTYTRRGKSEGERAQQHHHQYGALYKHHPYNHLPITTGTPGRNESTRTDPHDLPPPPRLGPSLRRHSTHAMRSTSRPSQRSLYTDLLFKEHWQQQQQQQPSTGAQGGTPVAERRRSRSSNNSSMGGATFMDRPSLSYRSALSPEPQPQPPQQQQHAHGVHEFGSAPLAESPADEEGNTIAAAAIMRERERQASELRVVHLTALEQAQVDRMDQAFLARLRAIRQAKAAIHAELRSLRGEDPSNSSNNARGKRSQSRQGSTMRPERGQEGVEHEKLDASANCSAWWGAELPAVREARALLSQLRAALSRAREEADEQAQVLTRQQARMRDLELEQVKQEGMLVQATIQERSLQKDTKHLKAQVEAIQLEMTDFVSSELQRYAERLKTMNDQD